MATTTVSSSSPSLPLNDKVAIVTGSSRGIGKSIALHLGSLGARIVVNYSSNKDQADLVAAELNRSCSSSLRAVVVQGDVSDPAQVKNLFDEAERAFGSEVHIVVNSAGVLDSNGIRCTKSIAYRFVYSMNTRGAFLCCKESANRVKRGGGGRIILLSSSMVAALRPGFGVYAASKAAVEAMVKVLAKELKGTGITANCVAPGPIATEMYFAGKSEEVIQRNIDECPLSRLGEPKDIATVVGFLASDAGEWVNGQVIRANGGYV
ncbi:NADPH-dependent aldehyde reductase-like protein, chloroplastic [Linum perenne]